MNINQVCVLIPQIKSTYTYTNPTKQPFLAADYKEHQNKFDLLYSHTYKFDVQIPGCMDEHSRQNICRLWLDLHLH
jgi:hypothetical protein